MEVFKGAGIPLSEGSLGDGKLINAHKSTSITET
jgi:hypothetical protein